jgi:hypothetical protein
MSIEPTEQPATTSVRRWQSGDRRVPCGVGIVLRLLAAGTVTVAQAAAVPIPARTNGSTKPGPAPPPRRAGAGSVLLNSRPAALSPHQFQDGLAQWTAATRVKKPKPRIAGVSATEHAGARATATIEQLQAHVARAGRGAARERIAALEAENA